MIVLDKDETERWRLGPVCVVDFGEQHWERDERFVVLELDERGWMRENAFPVFEQAQRNAEALVRPRLRELVHDLRRQLHEAERLIGLHPTTTHPPIVITIEPPGQYMPYHRSWISVPRGHAAIWYGQSAREVFFKAVPEAARLQAWARGIPAPCSCGVQH